MKYQATFVPSLPFTPFHSLSLLLLLIPLLFASCTPDRCRTPFGDGGTLDITMPDFADLASVGGSVTINRGHKGIFVRRTSYTSFVAFECACPAGCDVRLLPDGDWGGAVLECPTCHSRFETEYGNPLEGSATGCPLYEYSTHFDGYLLTIYP